jgi:hypothetical protein
MAGFAPDPRNQVVNFDTVSISACSAVASEAGADTLDSKARAKGGLK